MNTSDEAVISIRNLRMRFGENEVLKGIDMDIFRGQIIGYIGPNGAGKSTTVKLMLGILDGYEGEIRIFGEDIRNGGVEYKRRIGYVPESADVYESLTAQEYLTFIGELYGLDHETADAKVMLSVAVLISYQLMARIFDISEITVFFAPAWWHYLMPAAWFAAPFSLFLEHDVSAYYIVLSIAALAVPVISLILYVRLVAPRFEKNLQKLNDNSIRKGHLVSLRNRFQRKLAGLLCRTEQERLFYQFTQNVAGKERKLKLSLYPSLAFAVVMPFILMFGTFTRGKTPEEVLKNISEGRSYMGLYITVIMLSSVILQLSRSENYKGAWIYKVLPIETPVPVFRGAVKSFLARFIIPVFLLPSVIFILIMGAGVIPDVILVFFNMMSMLMFIFKVSKKELPFCRNFQYTQDGNTMGAVFLSFFITGLFAGVHFLLSLAPPYGVIANIVVSALLSIFLWKGSFRIGWKDVEF